MPDLINKAQLSEEARKIVASFPTGGNYGDKLIDVLHALRCMADSMGIDFYEASENSYARYLKTSDAESIK